VDELCLNHTTRSQSLGGGADRLEREGLREVLWQKACAVSGKMMELDRKR